MKAALELGRGVFLAPIGFLNAPRATGKSLTHDPERAPLARRAFEDHATGQYTKEQLLKRARTGGLTNRRGRRSHRKRLACCGATSRPRALWTWPSSAFPTGANRPVSARLSPQVPLRERATGSRLQILLERRGAPLV
jgi:hypothetical protein